eukprot:Plantae.Rhodophyta-Rhodochaete_pulchella.ctg4997.p1 GENE.Plantae.Rhodophyta-Rhodochaete_pulchella.ctg4997~~Plantae.Rhodophyta-Rhodochaete_pulchella.ctg4997.p1  ORF type:complete len:654 (+),score=94.50 Plantae.Rhodophyta-Rhodochaete_pulchella.ctg4997:1125-3086(+)
MISSPARNSNAIEMYMGNISLADEYRGMARVDKLQMLHTCFNLDVAVTSSGTESAIDGRLNSVQERARQLETELTGEARALRDKAVREYLKSRKDHEQLRSKTVDQWWMEALSLLEDDSGGDDLMSKVLMRVEETRTVGMSKSLLAGVDSIPSLREAIDSALERRNVSRGKLLELVESLPGYRDSECSSAIFRAGRCGQCRFVENPVDVVCDHCAAQGVFEEYERNLFFVRVRTTKSDRVSDARTTTGRARNSATEGHGGVSVTSEVDSVLKDVVAVWNRRTNVVDDETGRSGRKWLSALEAQKREFRQLQTLWRAEKDYLGSLDEVNMAKTRMSIRDRAEDVSEVDRSHRVLEEEVSPLILNWTAELKVSEAELRRKKGQVIYLRSLEGREASQSESKGQSMCPMCLLDLDANDFTVYPCGHWFCLSCTAALLDRIPKCVSMKSLLCPVCRSRTAAAEISYVSKTRRESALTEQSSSRYGTKIGAVTSCITSILEDDASSKILVFSQWKDVLNIVAQALAGCGVDSLRLWTGKRGKGKNPLQLFKTDSKYSVMLLPFRSGANGLNLTEASHVILIEPLLNSALESQAVGRVHRIGQRRETYVYHFVVRQTVEEQILAFAKESESRAVELKSETETVSLADVSRLFDLPQGQG